MDATTQIEVIFGLIGLITVILIVVSLCRTQKKDDEEEKWGVDADTSLSKDWTSSQSKFYSDIGLLTDKDLVEAKKDIARGEFFDITEAAIHTPEVLPELAPIVEKKPRKKRVIKAKLPTKTKKTKK